MPIRLQTGEEPIAGYVLARKLGKGGFGEVWEALAPGGVRVALKFIRLEGDHLALERRALETIRDIRHPHLLDVHFASFVEDYFVIAMPLCDRSLKDRLEECRGVWPPGLPRLELMRYMVEVAEAVDFLNENRHPSGDGRLVGVQHRDLKPHNIFLVGGSARVADFGLAKVLEASAAEHSGPLTANYAAPEAIQGRVSSRSDQYSLAITYVYLRTGRLPFRGETAHQILFAHVHDAPDLSALPEPERPAVLRALAKRPEDRWPDCREFIRTVQALGDEAANQDDATTVSMRGSDQSRPEPSPTTWPDGLTDRTTVDAPPGPEAPGPVGTGARRRPLLIGAGVATAGLVVAVAVAIGLTRLPGGPAPGTIPVAVPVARVAAVLPPAPMPPEKPAEPEEPRADAPSRDLAGDAHATLKKYCYRCHGVRFEVPGYNVLDRENLVARRGEGEKPYIKPGDPAGSETWQRVGVDRDMPPSGPKPSDAERRLIADWIAAGASFPIIAATARATRTEKDVLTIIRDHLQRAREADRPSLRYFTLHDLHDNRTVADADLRLARAGVAKLVNSLSWEADIVVPKAIDPDGIVLAVDLRELGWDRHDTWKSILVQYPYGLKHDKDRDETTRSLAAEVDSLAGTPVPYVRADWFVANASRPPLYHSILDLPGQAAELERKLGVDVESDFLLGRLARAGFAESGVSGENRVVDRHPARHGAYWKSYDFRRSDGKGNIFQNPLGPTFAANPFPRQAFEHAGGEIIFNLPNGLQGYLLVDAEGRRIDVGPSDIVADSLKTAGTAEVVNALSCMSCHQDGMRRFKDTVRTGMAVAGEARARAEDLYREQAAMDSLLDKDQARFLKAVEEATGAFLKVGEDADKPIRDFPEPIAAVARSYLKDLGPEAVAADLGLKGPDELTSLVRSNVALRRLGLGPLIEGGMIKRSQWDSLSGRLISTFQDAARELDLGTPFRIF